MVHRLLKVLYRFARVYWWFRQPLSLGARVALIRDEEIFLVKLTYTPGWHLPGGGIKKHETLAQCARRESIEEAAIEPEEMELFNIYYNRVEHKHDHVALFVSKRFKKTERSADALEVVGGAFFPMKALPADTTPATLRRIAEIQKKTEKASMW